LISTSGVQAQDVLEPEGLVRWSPGGMVIFTGNTALSAEMPQDGKVESVIYRQMEGESGLREIGRLSRAESFDEFEHRAGRPLVEQLMVTTRSSTEEQLWEYVKSNPGLAEYGFLVFLDDMWRAFGTAYFDEETAALPQGEEVVYEVAFILEDGSEHETRYRGSASAGRVPNILAPGVIAYSESDSLVAAQWASPIEGSEDVMFANLFRQEWPDGEFEQVPGKIMAMRNDEAELILYTWEESVEPERAFRYVLEPVDLMGNTGPKSDTLLVISVDFNNIPLMNQVISTETANGIRLSWEPLPNKPWLTGIEIRRSRDARQDYIVLDTLAITETEYIDNRLVPNVTYYYEFRVVTIRQTATLPSAIASGSFENREMPPNPPYGLTAVHEGEHIRLTWDSVEEPDLFAYYVYRGTSRYDSLVVISHSITDSLTFLDASELLDGRTNYVYAVKAVNMSGLESELSEFAAIRPNRTVQPPAPAGLSGYGELYRVRLSWRDVKRLDQAVSGYHIYRSHEPVNEDIHAGVKQPLEIPGIQRITDVIHRINAYDDLDVRPGQTLYYAISSVDIYGEESEITPFFEVRTQATALIAPGQVSARAINGRTEIRWSATRQEGATGYTVYRRSRGQTDPAVVGRAGIDETTFLDSEAVAGNLYWYSVSVIAGEIESPRSTEEPVEY